MRGKMVLYRMCQLRNLLGLQRLRALPRMLRRNLRALPRMLLRNLRALRLRLLLLALLCAGATAEEMLLRGAE